MSLIREVWGRRVMMMGLTRGAQDKVFEEKWSKAVGRWDRHQSASMWLDVSDPAGSATPGQDGSRAACSELASRHMARLCHTASGDADAGLPRLEGRALGPHDPPGGVARLLWLLFQSPA